LENIERSIIADSLRRKQGDVQATAALLSIPKQTLYDKIKRLCVNVDEIREGSTVRGILTMRREPLRALGWAGLADATMLLA
jgi:hypothetical protein